MYTTQSKHSPSFSGTLPPDQKEVRLSQQPQYLESGGRKSLQRVPDSVTKRPAGTRRKGSSSYIPPLGQSVASFFFFIFLNIFIDYAVTVVPFPPSLHSILPTPSLPHYPPIVHVHGSYL